MIDELVGKCYDKEVNSSFLMVALYDGRGSVAGLTGSSGGSMITYRYDAYGNTTKSNNTLNNPYQYNAEYTDSSTGLQYLRARYYDSSQGRITAKDTYLGNFEYPFTELDPFYDIIFSKNILLLTNKNKWGGVLQWI